MDKGTKRNRKTHVQQIQFLHKFHNFLLSSRYNVDTIQCYIRKNKTNQITMIKCHKSKYLIASPSWLLVNHNDILISHNFSKGRTLSLWRSTTFKWTYTLLPVTNSCSHWLTQYGQHSVVFQDLHGPWADKVDGLQGVSLPDEELPRGAEGGLDNEGKGAQAAPAGRLEQRQLKQLLVQVHGDVCPQLIWEVLQ